MSNFRRKTLALILLLAFLYQGPATALVTMKATKVQIVKTGTRHDPETGYYVYARFRIPAIKANQNYTCTFVALTKGKKKLIVWESKARGFAPRPNSEYEGFTNIKPVQVPWIKSVSVYCSLAQVSGTTVLPPVMIDPLITSEATVHLGNSVVFSMTDDGKWSGVVADSTVGTFVKGGDQGSYTTNCAFTSLKTGVTTVELTNAIGTKFTITITVLA